MSLLRNITALSAVFGLSASAIIPQPPAPEPIQRYRSLVDQIPASVSKLGGSERPNLRHEIETSYRYLRDTCPAMARIDISSPWNLADWMDRKILEAEWKAAPYSFRMNSFRAVSVQKVSEVKIRVLGRLYASIDSHPAFQVWVDDGLENFNRAFNKDPYIAAVEENWEWTAKSDRRLKKYIEHVGRILVESFLPDSAVSLPRIEIKREDVGYRGQHQAVGNIVRFNFNPRSNAIKYPALASQTIVHEYFHTVLQVIQNWSLNGKLANNAAFREMGEKFFYSGNKDLALVTNDVNYDIYKDTFKERWTYYIEKAVYKPHEQNLQTRAPGWIDNHPLTDDNRQPETGLLPQACYIK